MREIKFRAYHKTRKQMITPVWTFGEHYQFDNEFHNKWMYGIEAKDITLLQFTGMTDCEGKDIYEGDVLESTPQMLYLMEYVDGGRLVAKNLTHEDSYLHFNTNKLKTRYEAYKVVGNMYENPEMINENC
jgi:uncharacterized phage protein (TIGR01671 family)